MAHESSHRDSRTWPVRTPHSAEDCEAESLEAGGVGELLADDVVVEWPVSGERIVGRENYIRINAEYPEGWAINVLRIVADGEEVVSEVEVPHGSMGLFRVASFWTVREGKVTGGREYWTGSDPSPEWRAPYVQRQ